MLDTLLNSALFSNIALTLLHFLWQGLAVSVILKLILTITPHQSSRLRYTFSAFAMLANFLLPIITFFLLYQPELQDVYPQNDEIQHHILGFTLLTSESSLYADLLSALPYLTCAWIATISFLASRLLLEMYSVNQLPKKYSHPPLAALNERFLQLVASLNMTQVPKLVVSLSVDVPMAIGWIKPIVLLPASMITGLTPAQLDMLILHELAHIRRYDYLVNLLQSFVELLLFFHPAVYWVSKQMRIEREYCSDDIAVQHCGDALAYAHTLADTASLCSKHRHVIPTMAMAASGGDLKQRVIRLVNPQSCTSNIDKSKWLASTVAMLGLLIVCSNELTKLTYIDLNSDTNNAFHYSQSAAPGFVPSNKPLIFASDPKTKNSNKTKALLGNSTSVILSENSSNIEKPSAVLENHTKKTQVNNTVPSSNNTLVSTSALPSAEKNTVTEVKSKSQPLAAPTPISHKVDIKQDIQSLALETRTKLAEKHPSQTAKAQTITSQPHIDLAQKSKQITTANKPNNSLDKLVSTTVHQQTDKIKQPSSKNLSSSNSLAEEQHSSLSQQQKNTTLNPYAKQISALNQAPRYEDAMSKFDQNNGVKSPTKAQQLMASPEEPNIRTVSFKKAEPLKLIDPKYPTSAQRKKVELDLLVNFSINKEGKVENIEIEKKSRASYFKSAIISALEKWQFEPAKRNGSPIDSKMSKIFSFNLNLY